MNGERKTHVPTPTNLSAFDASSYNLVCQLRHDGRHIIPTGGGDNGKKPLIPRWAEYQERQPTGAELHEWQEKYHPTVWAVVCGAASGVIVVDTDNHERQKELEAYNFKPHVVTPKGAHFYIKHPGYPMKTAVGVLPGVDIRGDGGYANIIGTRSQDGGEYRLMIPPIEGTLYRIEDLPQHYQEAIRSNMRQRDTIVPIGNAIQYHQRNVTLTSLAGSMRRRGAPYTAIRAALVETNLLLCHPPLDETELERIAKSINRYEPTLQPKRLRFIGGVAL